MMTVLTGISFPETPTAPSTARTIPPQQGTSIRRIVTDFMSFDDSIADNFSV